MKTAIVVFAETNNMESKEARDELKIIFERSDSLKYLFSKKKHYVKTQ